MRPRRNAGRKHCTARAVGVLVKADLVSLSLQLLYKPERLVPERLVLSAAHLEMGDVQMNAASAPSICKLLHGGHNIIELHALMDNKWSVILLQNPAQAYHFLRRGIHAGDVYKSA